MNVSIKVLLYLRVMGLERLTSMQTKTKRGWQFDEHSKYTFPQLRTIVCENEPLLFDHQDQSFIKCIEYSI